MTVDPTDDDALAALIASAGISRTVSDLRGLLARAAASPETYPADAWVRLIAPNADTDIVAMLTALRDQMRPAAPTPEPSRLDRLRETLSERGVDAFILPRADEHQGEYLPARAQRLAWLTGFTGSAGTAVVLPDTAILFVDGRYTLQAAQQADPSRWDIRHLIRTPPSTYLRATLKDNRLGYDPRLHSVTQIDSLTEAVHASGSELVALDPNPVDGLWADCPPPPLGPVDVLDVTFTGVGATNKRAQVAATLTESGADATVLNQPESIAWLLNIRGRDVPYTPLPLAYATLNREGTVDLFIDQAKLDTVTRTTLGNQVALRPFEAIGDALDAFGAAGAIVTIDPDSATDWLRSRLIAAGAEVRHAPDPCVLPRARKNTVEIAGTRAAHRRDAAAIARFLKWIDDTAPNGAVTEARAVDALEGFRSHGNRWRGPSFPSISGFGANGAIVHYRVTDQTDRALQDGSLYLIDSGAQYLDGTTDITRTIAIGTPTQEMRERFTLVLKGHIAIATTRFPAGTTGGQIDALARQFLWKEGLDFDHGTGHGVGAFLGVHEGPQRISSLSRVPIEPGMILSNEPGYYKPDGYGIRIENLILAVESDPMPDNGRAMLSFETLTFAPIDHRLIEPSLLNVEEIAWLDAYHTRVRTMLAPALDPGERAWLDTATKPLGH